jgi:hypothetical protein
MKNKYHRRCDIIIIINILFLTSFITFTLQQQQIQQYLNTMFSEGDGQRIIGILLGTLLIDFLHDLSSNHVHTIAYYETMMNPSCGLIKYIIPLIHLLFVCHGITLLISKKSIFSLLTLSKYSLSFFSFYYSFNSMWSICYIVSICNGVVTH